MRNQWLGIVSVPAVMAIATIVYHAQDATALVAKQQRFDELARQPTGLLIPLYLYPANIHRNPVRRGLVERAEEFYWSSAAWSVRQTPIPIPVDPIPPEWTP